MLRRKTGLESETWSERECKQEEVRREEFCDWHLIRGTVLRDVSGLKRIKRFNETIADSLLHCKKPLKVNLSQLHCASVGVCLFI